MSDFRLTDGTWERIRISASEAVRLSRFIAEHAKCQSDVTIAVSHTTGIGQNVVVECNRHFRCQTDITAYEEW